ncbi:hypothetical protein BO70DRAFT_75344 [Aspergillus heteromorphus CBS 117.55]|uniref:Uncharacterized protein n=1 Tax=Aspergillus heteromorphus CBS 117.55 TaxID=1448321 RepID=A0A317WW85_9EURO|nr:uncharacterized protein BO70DRAFT_75344 [Aspergillus heteromorphus CBS 117.55]PWY90656.1 hypothetical protein BO70DRAFT_75344 [Aspergillus heteromorphus CBS 117.55]
MSKHGRIISGLTKPNLQMRPFGPNHHATSSTVPNPFGSGKIPLPGRIKAPFPLCLCFMRRRAQAGQFATTLEERTRHNFTPAMQSTLGTAGAACWERDHSLALFHRMFLTERWEIKIIQSCSSSLPPHAVRRGGVVVLYRTGRESKASVP